MYRHGSHGSGIAAQAMGQSSWQRTGPAHVAMIYLIVSRTKILSLISNGRWAKIRGVIMR